MHGREPNKGTGNFNPRSYKRSDMCIKHRIFKRLQISIHAPTRGATQVLYIGHCFPYFNPRSYKRSDFGHLVKVGGNFYFNPRSYKRSDDENLKFSAHREISIHAPTRGATKQTAAALGILAFQSTLLQEERRQTGCKR